MAKDPAKLAKARIKETVRNVVLGQGNRFIKELLRDKKVTIGATKADFVTNIMRAIDDDVITVADIESWLAEVEGWGNQHLYLYPPLAKSRAEMNALIAASTHNAFLNRAATYDFPDKLSLTSVTLDHDQISVSWHKGNDRWARLPAKDFRREEEGDLIEYRAHLQRFNRTVLRYEWRFDRAYSAVLMQLPLEGTLHKDSLDEVWKVLVAIGLVAAAPEKIALTQSVNALAEDPVHITASGRTMRTEGGYVDFVSLIPDRGIADIAALRTVDQGIDAATFQSADGRFRLGDDVHTDLSRVVNVEIFGGQRRMRIGVQCHRDDVYYLTDLVWARNQP